MKELHHVYHLHLLFDPMKEILTELIKDLKTTHVHVADAKQTTALVTMYHYRKQRNQTDLKL